MSPKARPTKSLPTDRPSRNTDSSQPPYDVSTVRGPLKLTMTPGSLRNACARFGLPSAMRTSRSRIESAPVPFEPPENAHLLEEAGLDLHLEGIDDQGVDRQRHLDDRRGALVERHQLAVWRVAETLHRDPHDRPAHVAELDRPPPVRQPGPRRLHRNRRPLDQAPRSGFRDQHHQPSRDARVHVVQLAHGHAQVSIAGHPERAVQRRVPALVRGEGVASPPGPPG